ncbi:MAG: hypothetical protein ACR2QR_09085 [Woeseiaceae bacterium]
MLQLATFIDLQEQQHTLGLYCMACDRWGEADLPRLIASGRGKRLIIEASFRCCDCGGLVDKQLRPPVPQVGGAIAYVNA